MSLDLIQDEPCLAALYRLCREHPPVGPFVARLRWLLFRNDYEVLAAAYDRGARGLEPGAWAPTSFCAAAYLAGVDAVAVGLAA